VLLLLHEILPTGPFWTLVVWTLMAIVGTLVVWPLYWVRRKYGPFHLVLAAGIPALVLAAVVGKFSAVFIAAFTAVLIHARVSKKPDGLKFVDLSLGVLGLWFSLFVAVAIAL
jgi:hypothetical protein